MAITNITSVKIKNCIVDELHIRQRTDNGISLTSAKEGWQIDTYLLAKFLGNLEAGNLANSGVQIVKFAIKRRKVDELTPITLGYVDYDNTGIEYTDYTQTSGNYVYSIIPIGENGLEGSVNDVNVDSSFTGWFIVDGETQEVLAFDKFIGNDPNVNTQLNQGRTVINTMSRFPSVFYSPQQYHSFSLSTVIVPSELERSGQKYEQILNKFITNPKPFLIKGGSGEVYICDISNLRKSAPMNTWQGNDYFTLQIDALELMEYDEYIAGVIS